MAFLSSLFFNVVFFIVNIIVGLTLSVSLLLPRKYIVKATGLWLSAEAFIEKYIGGLTYKVVGKSNLPKGAFIVASKHQSEWETYKMHLLLKDPAIVLKRELLRIPVVGWFMARTGGIPIDRKACVKAIMIMLTAARSAAAEGRPIVIFPEGTRVKVGESRRYKAGIAALYQDLKIPVVPMALNSGLFWPKNSFMKKRGMITVEFLPPIPPGLPREDMMRRLHDVLEPATDRLIAEGRKKLKSQK